MAMSSRTIPLLLIAATVLSGFRASPVRGADLSSARAPGPCAVQFRPVTPDLDRRIVISSEIPADLPMGEVRQEKTTQGLSSLTLFGPDTTRPGPWTSVVVVRPAGGSPLSVRISDHISGGVVAHWISEKLIYVEAWWGRAVATDLVLDATSGDVLYKELADYGRELQPECVPSSGRR